MALRKTLVLVGLMGAGKSTVGKRLASQLGVGFVDSDDEIVAAAGQSIADMFAEFGEAYFRDGERKVVDRLLEGAPCVLATGGGAFMSDDIRALIAQKAVSVWINADLETLWQRVSGKPGRPLLQQENPKQVLNDLMEARYPTYALADYVVESKLGNPHDTVVDDIIEVLEKDKDRIWKP